MAATEEVSVRQLSVEKPDGRRVTASALALEDVGASGQMDTPILSDWRAKKIAVPALQPGDRLTYDATIVRSASLIPGHFWIDHHFTQSAVVISETLEIDAPSSRPLNIRVRRGTDAPESAAAAGRRVRRWTHQQAAAQVPPRQPSEIKALLEEAKKGPDIRVSSFKDWNELAMWFAAVIDERSEPDDAVRSRARELTRGLDKPEQRLEALYAFVSTQIRYISLAFGAGRLEPRTAGQVLSTQYGDCKDKHVLLASLARAVDIAIKPVLISDSIILDEQLPSPTQFDHLISVKTAADPAHREWMDSTSGVLPSGALFAPLRNKRALLIPTGVAKSQQRAETPVALVTTPADLRTPAVVTIDISGTIDDRGLLTTRVARRITGDLEFLVRLTFRDAGQQAKMDAAKEQAHEDGLREATVKDATFKDDGPGRPVELRYEATHAFPLTYDKPWQIWIPTPSLALPAAPTDAGTATELGATVDLTLTATYEVPPFVRARPPVPVSVEREFATYRSTYRVEGRTLLLERRLRTLVKEVPAAHVDSYRAFLRAVDADFRQSFAVDPIARTESAPATADELNSAGHQAIEKRQYKQAIELLERATKLDPKHKYAWNNLGRAYNGIREYQEAVVALERQIVVNPFDEFAYANLGRALWGLKPRYCTRSSHAPTGADPRTPPAASGDPA